MAKVECPECQGEGMVKDRCGGGSMEVCWKCDGTGEVEAEDRDEQSI